MGVPAASLVLDSGKPEPVLEASMLITIEKSLFVFIAAKIVSEVLFMQFSI